MPTTLKNMAKRVAFRYITRQSSSNLPSDDGIGPGHMPLPGEISGFSTLREEGNSADQSQGPRDTSMFDVEFADDLAKDQSRRRDEKDFSGLQLQYNKPEIPDNVRR